MSIRNPPEDKKPAPPAPATHDFAESGTASLTGELSRDRFVSNTMPAPPNPHKDGGKEEKK